MQPWSNVITLGGASLLMGAVLASTTSFSFSFSFFPFPFLSFLEVYGSESPSGWR